MHSKQAAGINTEGDSGDILYTDYKEESHTVKAHDFLCIPDKADSM
jgi:hypothetical protein